MKQLNCLLVDDEPPSRDVLLRYLAQTPSLRLVAACGSAMEAGTRLQEETVDLLFLDINLPGLSGISFARSLRRSPLIIFTTAYPEYAVQGFELEAVDYLVKPFSYERFLKAVHRALDRFEGPVSQREAGLVPGQGPGPGPGQRPEQSPEQSPETASGKITLKADRRIYAVDVGNIRFLEGKGDYVQFHLTDRKLMVHGSLKTFESQLPAKNFLRIHKSWLVNLDHITCIEGNQVHLGDDVLSCSPKFREVLLFRYGRT